MNTNKIINIKPGIDWVGICDTNIKRFDIVMTTEYGTTYNSYFINADKKTVIETAKLKFWDEYLNKLKQVCNPSEIEYIVVNHTEPDHTGSILELIKLAPNATVVGSGNAIRYLENILNVPFKSQVVKDGDTLSLGNKNLRFIGAPNLHWPDSMYSYLEEDKILFTCDSFGAHFAIETMFEDTAPNYDDAFKYYFDVILRPFSRFMLKAIEKIRPLEIDLICTGHGPVLRKNLKKYIDLSEQWSSEFVTLPQKNKVLVAYVSAYGYTAEVAQKITDGLRSEGIEVDLCDIETMPLDELGAKIEQANAYIFGSPTINQNTLLQIYQCFALMTPLRDRGKLAGTFGSYGWSGEATKIIEANFTVNKFKFFETPLTHFFRPDAEHLQKALEYGQRFAKTMNEMNNN